MPHDSPSAIAPILVERPTREAPLRVIPGHRALAAPLAGATIAIGNFDGVHRGHQRLFAEIRARAASRAGTSVVLTFDPHPARLFRPELAPPLITTLARRVELIEDTGVDACVIEPFDHALAGLTPVEFVDRVLCSALGAAEVCVGYDFTFGSRRSGDVHLLARLGDERGFRTTVIDPVSVEGMVCSSTKVRQFVLEGHVDGAAILLGRPFEVEGEVVAGAGRGRTIGVPTANLRPDTELLPRGGVYAGWAELAPNPEPEPDAPEGPKTTLPSRSARTRIAAAINVGTNPTFTAGGTGAPLSIEAHLLSPPPHDLLGTRLRLGFTARLRDERRFAGVEELVAQIRRDIDRARDAWIAAPPSIAP